MSGGEVAELPGPTIQIVPTRNHSSSTIHPEPHSSRYLRKAQQDIEIMDKDKMMSYRNPKSPLQRTKFSSASTPPPSFFYAYDADDEDTLELDVNSFALPDGTSALSPADLQRIEEATNLLGNLGVRNHPSTSSTNNEHTESDKENAEPNQDEEDMDTEEDEDDMDFGNGGGMGGNCQAIDESDTDDDARTDDSTTPMSSQQRTELIAKLDQQEQATSLEEANTQIWILNSVIKQQERAIKDLKKVNTQQANAIRVLASKTASETTPARSSPEGPFFAKMKNEHENRKRVWEEDYGLEGMNISGGNKKRFKLSKNQYGSAPNCQGMRVDTSFDFGAVPVNNMSGGHFQGIDDAKDGFRSSERGGEDSGLNDIFKYSPTGDRVRNGRTVSRIKEQHRMGSRLPIRRSFDSASKDSFNRGDGDFEVEPASNFISGPSSKGDKMERLVRNSERRELREKKGTEMNMEE